MTHDYDVAIIGGGPAGATMAAYLAKGGAKCVVFERDHFPRPHVGESLVPSSTRVFKEIGFLPVMEEAGFPHKLGAVWTSGIGRNLYTHDWNGLGPECHADIRFAERDQPGVDQVYTYHVDRGEFDRLLLRHAHTLGAEVVHGVPVTGIDRSHPEGAVVNLKLGGRTVPVTARIVVDASGRRTLVGSQLRWKVKDPVFDQYALHTWFEGYDRKVLARADGLTDYIFVHFLPITNSWVWQIPITDTVTSIGVVTQKRHFKNARSSREAFFWECVAARPEFEGALRAARQIRPLKDEGDYSYAMTQLTDDRLLLIGDAARFVDPIFSTGVSIALNSARLASLDVLRALETGDTSRAAFAEYEATIRRGTRNWYNFITVYYRLNVLFTAFISDPRYRLDVLKLLQGDVYDEDEPPVLSRMREVVAEVEGNPDHPWHKLLGELTANAFTDLVRA